VKQINLCNLALLRQLKVDKYPNHRCSCSDPIIPGFIVQQCSLHANVCKWQNVGYKVKIFLIEANLPTWTYLQKRIKILYRQ